MGVQDLNTLPNMKNILYIEPLVEAKALNAIVQEMVEEGIRLPLRTQMMGH